MIFKTKVEILKWLEINDTHYDKNAYELIEIQVIKYY